jgi:PKHD-type hydroxylase
MNTSSYWYFKSALTPKFCDDVIKYGLSKTEQMAQTGNIKKKLNKEEIKTMKQVRNSDIAWLDDLWIYKEIHPYVDKANEKAGWNFQWDFSESCQFTKYKLNQYYDWHCDSYSKPFNQPNNINKQGKIRKLSVTCQLTDGSEYEGGELEFDFRDYDPSKRDESKHLIKAKEILPKGSIVVFPSHLWHRVKPVRKGIRYSLVLWNIGYPFK